MEGKAQSGERADRYVAELAHELRTPLTAIIGYADAIASHTFGPVDERYTDYADIIREAGRRMLAMAEDLLARARAEEAGAGRSLSRFDAADPVVWAARLMRREAEAAGVRLAVETPRSAVAVEACFDEIVRIVVNLAANAVRHTPEGGEVSVTLTVEAEHLVLSVDDTGTGLASDAQTRGRGLGIVRALAEAAGGRLELSDRPGGGTRATVRLPAPEARP